MLVVLHTARLLLRPLTAADVDHLFALDSDPEVMRFLSGGAPTPRDLIRDTILPRLCGYAGRGAACGAWAAIERASSAFIGWFSLRPPDSGVPGERELGYRLQQSAWGKGYATEGARALIGHGFREPGVQRILATTYEHNIASRRVSEKAGLVLVRRYRLTPADLLAPATYHAASPVPWDGDDVEYALERAAWEQAALAPH